MSFLSCMIERSGTCWRPWAKDPDSWPTWSRCATLFGMDFSMAPFCLIACWTVLHFLFCRGGIAQTGYCWMPWARTQRTLTAWPTWSWCALLIMFSMPLVQCLAGLCFMYFLCVDFDLSGAQPAGGAWEGCQGPRQRGQPGHGAQAACCLLFVTEHSYLAFFSVIMLHLTLLSSG